MSKLRWWWYDVVDYRAAQWFSAHITCRLLGHDWRQKMSGQVCNRCATFEHR